MIVYNANDPCPYKPIHTEEWLESFFAKNYFKKPYDRFMWWRSYVSKNKILPNKATLLERIKNGDFDPAPYKFEAEIVEHRLRKKYAEFEGDYKKFLEVCAVDLARRKRLLEDQEKEENKRLTELYKGLSRRFDLTREELDEEMFNFNGETVLEFYNHILKKSEDKPY